MSNLDLKKLIGYRKEGFFPSFYHIDTDIPAGMGIKKVTRIPPDKIYVVTRGVHDVEDGIFEVRCVKDGAEVFPLCKITGDLMEYIFTFPFVALNKMEAYIYNLDKANSHPYRFTVYVMVCDASKFEKEME